MSSPMLRDVSMRISPSSFLTILGLVCLINLKLVITQGERYSLLQVDITIYFLPSGFSIAIYLKSFLFFNGFRNTVEKELAGGALFNCRLSSNLKRHISKEEVQMANKNIKISNTMCKYVKCKSEVQNILSFHYSMMIIKQRKMSNWMFLRTWRKNHHTLWGWKSGQPLWETSDTS